MLPQGQTKSNLYFSFAPLYVKSPPQRITSHQVYTSVITLGHIPAGHSYAKVNVSPFSKPSRQLPALPSSATNSNAQSSITHFFIIIFSFYHTSFAFVLQRLRAKPIPLKLRTSKGSLFGRAPAIAGERVLCAQLSPLRRLRRHLSQRARLFVSPIITQIGRESKSDIPTSSE